MAENTPKNPDPKDFIVERPTMSNPNPDNTLPPTEGQVLDHGIDKQVQNQNAGLPTSDEQRELNQLKDVVGQKKDDTRTPGSQPQNVILPEVRERMAELARKAREKHGMSDTPETDEPNKNSEGQVDGTRDLTAKGLENKDQQKESAVKGNDNRNLTGNKRVDDMEKQCAEILAEHGGLEGNIPVGNVYWGLRNMIRAELSKMNM